jgi:hypothetical protein
MRLSTLDNGRIGMRRDALLVIDAHVDARRVRVPARTAIARERHRAGAGRDGPVAAPPRPPYLRIVSGK